MVLCDLLSWYFQFPTITETLKSSIKKYNINYISVFLPSLKILLKKIYKVRCKRLRLLMINKIPAKICWLIEAKARLVGDFSDPFVSYMSDFGKSTFAKKGTKWLGSKCPNCVRLAYNKPRYKTLGMVSVRREYKIKFIKDDISKESLKNIL